MNVVLCRRMHRIRKPCVHSEPQLVKENVPVRGLRGRGGGRGVGDYLREALLFRRGETARKQLFYIPLTLIVITGHHPGLGRNYFLL